MKRRAESTQHLPKTLVVTLHTPDNFTGNKAAYHEEFLHLVESNDIAYDEALEISLRLVDSTCFLTKGKLEELAALCQAGQFQEVIFSETLNANQERSLASMLKCTIIDRTALILSIFEKRATSAEGKLQVSFALLRHQKSRLAGRGIHLSQQAGRIGTRGPGETQKERDLQHIETLMLRITRELEHLERVRATQRKQRLTRQVPLLCMIGYTNAGKSTLLNALTKSEVVVQDQLFSTLDTTTRELYIDHEKVGLLSDTVGFIQNLPPSLIAAFKSTLHELEYAHLLLHVVDVSNPDWPHHIDVVEGIIGELNVDKPVLYILNKADLLTPEGEKLLRQRLPLAHPAVITSTQSPEGLASLVSFLSQWSLQNGHPNDLTTCT